MLREVSAQLERAYAILPYNISAPHGADKRCDVCPQQQVAVLQEVSSLESSSSVVLIDCMPDSQGCSNTKHRQQTGHSEERKREEDIESLRVQPPTMAALPVKRPSPSDPAEMLEAFRAECPQPSVPGVNDQEVLNQSSSAVTSHETHQVPEGKPDPSINSPRARCHLRDLFAKAKDAVQQLETTVLT